MSDHLGIVNDLASYEKQLRAMADGKTSGIINIVDVVTKATLLEGTDDAKNVVWALQVQIEKQMKEELEGLQDKGLSDEDWWFLEAVVKAVTGNVMFCVTTSRYGGEAAKIS